MRRMSQDKPKQDNAPVKGSQQPEAGKRSTAQPVDALRQGKVGQCAAATSSSTAPDASPEKRTDTKHHEPSAPKSDAKAISDVATGAATDTTTKVNPQGASASADNNSSHKSSTEANTAPSAASTVTSKAPSPMNKATTHAPNQTASSTTANKKKNPFNAVWTGVGVGGVLVIAALIVGLWWQQQRFEAVAKEVATRLQLSDQQSAQASERATQALTLATAQREVVDQLRREQAVSASELKVLQQAWEAANDGLDQTLLLNDLRRLIGMAKQELTLFGNVSSAISILSSVRSMLTNQADPALTNLQQAVTTDLARLRAAPQVDVANLSAELDSLIQLVGKAPLLTPQGQLISGVGAGVSGEGATDSSRNTTGNRVGPAASVTWWQEATDTVTRWAEESSAVLAREFADVLSIRKADDPQALLLSEEQVIQLRANVRSMLLSAQLALMTRQPDIWRSELTEVQSLLNTRFDKENLDTRAAIKLLDELLQAPLAIDVPSIHGTLNALAAADRALSIPDSPADASTAAGAATHAANQTAPESASEPAGQMAADGVGDASSGGAGNQVNEGADASDGNGPRSRVNTAGQGS